MAEYGFTNTTTTGMKGSVTDFSPGSENPDGHTLGITYWDYPNSAEYLGYYKQIPELKKAIDSLATWTCGKGVKTDARTKFLLENIRGWGEDSFQQICWNLIVQKKVFGCAFAEIVRNQRDTIINIKPLYTGDMRVIVGDNGIITGYEHRSRAGSKKWKTFETHEILHISNDRIANEIHGTSVIEAVKWIIDARNEAMRDERIIRHRELALGVLEVDTEDPSEIAKIKTQYANAVKNGEVLLLSKGVAELKDNPNAPRDRLEWIRYLENAFYQAVGIPRVIATSENFTEASSKVGYLTFEPIYTREQVELEADLWNQLGIKIKFERPPSLTGIMQEDEEKNTGQVGIQPNEVEATAGRVE